MNHRHDLWTPHQEQRLLEICAHTHRASDIARALEPYRHGVSRNAIIGKVERMRRLGHQIEIGKPGGGYPGQNKPRKVRNTPQSFARVETSRMTPPKPKPPPAPARPEVCSPRLLTLLDLKRHHCRWPIGDGPPYLFCGAVAERGRSYCPAHCQIARGRIMGR